MKISIRDYRGVERADVDLEPIALVAGRNEQGKSCVAQAARAALAGLSIPIPGVAKKDAKLLVREGAEKGFAEVLHRHAGQNVTWPAAEFKSWDDNLGDHDERMACTDIAVGAYHIFDQSQAERATALARYIDSEPTADDLAAALADAGFTEAALTKVWQAIEAEGWDRTHAKVKEHTTRLKGQWEATTGEKKWGVRKAAGWMPEGLDPNSVAECLERSVADAKAGLERLIAAAAVARHDVEGLRKAAAGLADLEAAEAEALAEKERLHKVYGAWWEKEEPRPLDPGSKLECPECHTRLVVRQGALVAADNGPSDDEVAAARKAYDDWHAGIGRDKEAFETAALAHRDAQDRLQRARQAAAKLEELEGQEAADVSEGEIEAARERVQRAEEALIDRDRYERATSLHEQIGRNAKLIEILAPDGLRRRKLAAGLEAFNAALAELCKVAKWPAVRLDENLDAHYGTRPLWAASASGQFRARVVVQVAMAKMDGSAAVVIDEADILDVRGRNGLLALVSQAHADGGPRALVCMTISREALVPDLAGAGLGRSYWIEAGVARAMGEAQEEAA